MNATEIEDYFNNEVCYDLERLISDLHNIDLYQQIGSFQLLDFWDKSQLPNKPALELGFIPSKRTKVPNMVGFVIDNPFVKDLLIDHFSSILIRRYQDFKKRLNVFQLQFSNHPQHLYDVILNIKESVNLIMFDSDFDLDKLIYDIQETVDGLLFLDGQFLLGPTKKTPLYGLFTLMEKLNEVHQSFTDDLHEVIEDIRDKSEIRIVDRSTRNQLDFEKITEKILLLNELGIIDHLRDSFENLSGRKLAKIVAKILGPIKVNSVKRPIDSIENPPTKMSKKNNPYHNPKNLENYKEWVAELNLKYQNKLSED
jgi:hypothetical protein